jgi:hypothetical protein
MNKKIIPIVFEFTYEQTAVLANVLMAFRSIAKPKRKNGTETVEKIACIHLQEAVSRTHYAKLIDATPINGKVSYKFFPHEAFAIYSFTAQKKEFYFFNVQVETNDNI